MPSNVQDIASEYYKQKPDFIDLWTQYPPQTETAIKPVYSANMPVHPKEEETTGSITDQVAKESSDSTASTHGLHSGETGASSGGKASVQDHKATPGPAISQNIGEPESKDDLKKRAAELNDHINNSK